MTDECRFPTDELADPGSVGAAPHPGAGDAGAAPSDAQAAIRPGLHAKGEKALEHARRGFRVIALHWVRGDRCSCGSPECKSPGKHPLLRAWPGAATSDGAAVAEQWRLTPNANIGILLADGLVVVDVDRHEGGADGFGTLAKLEAAHGPLPETLQCLTAHDGLHLFLRGDAGPTRSIGEGLEVRSGADHYVVADGSESTGGRRWAWEAGHHPDDMPIATAPAWLRAVSLPDEHKAAPPAPNTIGPGGRNRILASLAGTMRRRGMGEEAIRLALEAENAERCVPPLDGAEVAQIARSVVRYRPEEIALQEAPPEREEEEAPLPPEPTESKAGSTKPQLNAGEKRLEVISAEGWAAVVAANAPARLFLHGGRPVRYETDDRETAVLADLTRDRLRYELARAAEWVVRRKVRGAWEEAAAMPPRDVVLDMLAHPLGAVSLPPVDRIVGAPVFAADGTLQATPGYHRTGRVIVRLPPGLRIPNVPPSPTVAEVSAAVELYDELFADFPFAEEADRAAAFALVLLPFVRDLIEGPTPLHLIEAPAAGTGKGLLATVALMPGVGADVGTLTQGRDEDEWRKRLSTVLREGRAAALIDNVTRPLASGVLSSALTTTLWADRLLGTLDPLNLPVRCVWVLTGNNLEVSTEIARRCVRCRLDARMDRPFQRDPGRFRHPKLREWASEKRGDLIAAALTVVRAWLAEGRPEPSVRPLGSYESWSRVIGGILEVAGVPGFLENLDSLYDRADSEGAVWRRFVTAWWETFRDVPVGVADLHPIAQAMPDFDLGSGQERSQKILLGKGLGRRRDVVLGGFRIEPAGTRQRLAQWRLTRTQPGDQG